MSCVTGSSNTSRSHGFDIYLVWWGIKYHVRKQCARQGIPVQEGCCSFSYLVTRSKWSAEEFPATWRQANSSHMETVLALIVEGFLKAILLERPLHFHLTKDWETWTHDQTVLKLSIRWIPLSLTPLMLSLCFLTHIHICEGNVPLPQYIYGKDSFEC